MKFLLDQDVYAVTACFLEELGHDVVTASQTGHEKSEDFQLLQCAGTKTIIGYQRSGFRQSRFCAGYEGWNNLFKNLADKHPFRPSGIENCSKHLSGISIAKSFCGCGAGKT